MLKWTDLFIRVISDKMPESVFNWRLEMVREGSSNWELQLLMQSCRTVGPWGPRDGKLLTNLRIIKLNTKLLFSCSWDFHFGGDEDCGSYKKQLCTRISAPHKQRRPSYKVMSSLTLEMFRKIRWTHGRDVVEARWVVSKVSFSYKTL